MSARNRQSKMTGYGLAAVSLVLYGAAIIFFVTPLSDWLDTFLVVSWLFLPAVVGSVAFAVLEPRGAFDEDRELS